MRPVLVERTQREFAAICFMDLERNVPRTICHKRSNIVEAKSHGFPRSWLSRLRRILGFVWICFAIVCVLFCFPQAFHAPHLGKYPRQPCGSSWYRLELQGLTIGRFRQTFPFLVGFLVTRKSMKVHHFPLLNGH